MDYIGTGFLSYLEGTYKYEVMTLHLRQGLFLINNWDDRIYAYEHDAPGSFTVPAAAQNVISVADIFRAKIVDVAKESLIVELTGTQAKIDAFLNRCCSLWRN